MRIDLMQLQFIDRKLRVIATETEKAMRVDFEITSLFRIDDDGVHGTLPLRGIDWGCKVEVIGRAVESYINARWIYDPERPHKVCCMYHKTKSGEWHLHLQTHSNTRRK